jgi:Xaa-Pro dipeptidase
MAGDWDFLIDEYQSRVNAVRRVMRDRGIDALVVDSFEHLVYLFGYLPTAAKYQCCLLPADGTPLMIVRSMDRTVYQHQSWVTSFREFGDHEDPIAILVEELKALGPRLSKLAFEYDSHILTVSRFKHVAEALPNCVLVDFAPVIAEMRLIKSPKEIEYLRSAAAIADRCMSAAIEAATAGVSEREPAAAAYMTAMRAGADNGRVLLSSSGNQSDSIHGRLGTRTLAEGDILHLEMVPQVRGYSARIMRPVFIGTPPAEISEAAARMVEIQDQQIAAIAPGKIARDVDAIAREQLLAGVCNEYRNHTGYTLGYHAQPRTTDHTRILTPNATWRFEAGMVFHIFMAARGMAFGETVLVTDTGSERLTSMERRLFLR